jgi:hypothetical protein
MKEDERHNTLKRDGGEKEEKEEDDQNTTELHRYITPPHYQEIRAWEATAGR